MTTPETDTPVQPEVSGDVKADDESKIESGATEVNSDNDAQDTPDETDVNNEQSSPAEADKPDESQTLEKVVGDEPIENGESTNIRDSAAPAPQASPESESKEDEPKEATKPTSPSKPTAAPFVHDPNKITLRFLFAGRDGIHVVIDCKPDDTVGEVKGALMSVWPDGTFVLCMLHLSTYLQFKTFCSLFITFFATTQRYA